MFDKVVLVTRKTRLDLLVERFNTRAQAKFYLEHAGLDFGDAEREHDTYTRALEATRRHLEGALKLQVLDRALVSTYFFSGADIVVVLGQDGTVANVAKYVGAQPVIGLNPDPARFDGVLLPFTPDQVPRVLDATVRGTARHREVTLAEAVLSDGQRLKAFNDLFIGARTHVSAHYRLSVTRPAWERQSSSGVIVATGAGSTGWLSSVCTGAGMLARSTGGAAGSLPPMRWESPELFYVVREPFISKHSGASLVSGRVERAAPLAIESLMPSGGVIFGDGMEDDALGFTSGLVAHVGPAEQRARLVVGAGG